MQIKRIQEEADKGRPGVWEVKPPAPADAPATPHCFLAPQPMAHTCMDTSNFAAVFIDDVSDSPIIACPGYPSNVSMPHHVFDPDIDANLATPLANSTLIEQLEKPIVRDAEGEGMPGIMDAATPHDGDTANADAAQNVNAVADLDRGARGLIIGPREYAYIVNELWPAIDPLFVGTNYHLDIYELVRATGVPNYLGARIRIPSNINCDAWDHLLHGYHDAEISEYLRFGWPGGYTAPTPPTTSDRNHPSAVSFPAHVQRFIDKEVGLGAMLGPFTAPPFFPWSQVSPLMTVEKKDSQDRRVIIDLSFPIGAGVNAGIPKNFFQGEPKQYSLPSITDLADLIIAAGPRCCLWKADLERAYRQLRCDPLDYPLLCISHDGAYFTDICPSFGCRGSSMSQQRVSQAVCYLMSTEGFSTLAYVDDFCGVQASESHATTAYVSFANLTDTLGLKLAPDKCAPPSTKMEWLGFLFDTEEMSITLPPHKLREIVTLANTWSSKSWATRKELQQLAGKLNHISQCVAPARKFMCRILAALRSAPQAGTIKIHDDLRRDVAWFARYTAECNGRVLMKESLPVFDIQCDACLEGGGGFSATHYYSSPLSDPMFADMHISQIEAFNIVLAIKTLLPGDLRSVQVRITTDNIAAMHTLNSGKTRDPVLAACSREVWLTAALRELEIVVVHAPGASLVLADALSRRHKSKAHNDIAIQMTRHLGLTRASLHDINSVLTSDL